MQPSMSGAAGAGLLHIIPSSGAADGIAGKKGTDAAMTDRTMTRVRLARRSAMASTALALFDVDDRASSAPPTAFAYVHLETDGFTEDGGAVALSSASTSTDVTFTTLGLRAATSFSLGSVKATARGVIGWRHASGDVTALSSFVFAGGDAFTIAGVPTAEDAALIEAGLDFDSVSDGVHSLSCWALTSFYTRSGVEPVDAHRAD